LTRVNSSPIRELLQSLMFPNLPRPTPNLWVTTRATPREVDRVMRIPALKGQNKRVDESYISPFQGWALIRIESPGRCPGDSGMSVPLRGVMQPAQRQKWQVVTARLAATGPDCAPSTLSPPSPRKNIRNSSRSRPELPIANGRHDGKEAKRMGCDAAARRKGKMSGHGNDSPANPTT